MDTTYRSVVTQCTSSNPPENTAETETGLIEADISLPQIPDSVYPQTLVQEVLLRSW